jgi:hypothetical protein
VLTETTNISIFDDYGLTAQKNRPSYQKHTRAVTEINEQSAMDNGMGFVPYSQKGFMFGELPSMSSIGKVSPNVGSSYYKDGYTVGGSTSAQ